MEMFKVIKPGPYTTVQDGGRHGYQQYGVPPAGVLDDYAFRAANLLVGNQENAAVLEITFLGPHLEALAEAELALTGAEMPVSLNGEPVEGWAGFRVKPGDRVALGPARSGCRSYLSVTGGIDVPVVMGSRSCYVGAGIGGHNGRILMEGDVLPRGEGRLLRRSRKLPGEFIPRYCPEILLRAVPGPQDDFFDRGLETFFESSFTVSSDSNRMGYRLEGPVILQKEGFPKSIISEPSVRGGVQIPADGQPIILLVEQTVGGYTKIATVISTDIPRVAQAKPGDKIRFVRVSLEDAHEVYREREALFAKIRDLLSKDPSKER